MSKSVRKKTEFVWDEIKLKAVEGIARGENMQRLAESLNVADRTLRRWQEHPDFKIKVSEAILDIDVSMKSERIKIAKAEIKRLLARLEYQEDKPCSRDLITALKYVGEEMGDYTEHKEVNIKGEGVIFYIPENGRNKTAKPETEEEDEPTQ